MPSRRISIIFRTIHFIFAGLMLLILASCAQPTRLPAIAPTSTATSSPKPTATARQLPSVTPTQTEVPLPKEPALLSVIGKGKVYQTAWSPDRQVFAVSASDAIRLYQAVTHQLLAEFPAQESANLRFSPDGRLLAVVPMFSGDILIYDLKTDQLITQVTPASVQYFSFKNDDSGFAFSSSYFDISTAYGTAWIEVYNLGSNQPLYTFDKNGQGELWGSPDHYYEGITFSTNGRWLAAADDANGGQARIWDMTTGELASFHPAHPGITCLAYSPDGKWLASGGTDKLVRVWNAQTGQYFRVFTGFHYPISDLAFTADSLRLIVKASDKDHQETIAYDIQAGQKVAAPVEPALPEDLGPFLAQQGYLSIHGIPQFSPDGNRLAIPNGDNLVVWDLVRKQPLVTLNASGGSIDNKDSPPIYQIAFSPDGKRLALTQSDGSVDIWDVVTGQRVIKIPSQVAATIAFSKNGQTLAAAGQESIELWNIASSQLLWKTDVSGLRISALQFTADDQTILAAASSGLAVLWLDAASGRQTQSFAPNLADPGPTSIALQEPLLAALKPDAAEDLPLRIWDLRTGQVLQDLSDFYDRAYSGYFTFSPDARLFAGDERAYTGIWSTVTGQELFQSPNGLISPVFSPDSQSVIFADDLGRLQFWDVRSLLSQAPRLPTMAVRPLPTMAPPSTITALSASGVKSVCLDVKPVFSPDPRFQGQLVLKSFGSSTTNIFLFNLSSGAKLGLPEYTDDITTSPDGKWLSYESSEGSGGGKPWLVFQDPKGKQIKYRWADWAYPEWLGSDWLSYSIFVNNQSLEIPPTQVIGPTAGPGTRLKSEYPGLEPFMGPVGSPFHFGTRSVKYDPSLELVVYEKYDEKNGPALVLYDRLNGKTLASLPDNSYEHYLNDPIWSADGQFFVAALIQGYTPDHSDDPEDWFRIGRDGTVEQLTHFKEQNLNEKLSEAHLSPDGKKLAFFVQLPPDANHYLIVLDLNSRVMTDYCLSGGFSSAGYLVWSPDARYLVVSQSNPLTPLDRTVLIDLENGQAMQVSEEENTHPEGWLNLP